MPPVSSPRSAPMQIAAAVFSGLASFILLDLAGLHNRMVLYTVALTTTMLVSAAFDARHTGRSFARAAPRALIAGLIAGMAVGLYATAVMPS